MFMNHTGKNNIPESQNIYSDTKNDQSDTNNPQPDNLSSIDASISEALITFPSLEDAPPQSFQPGPDQDSSSKVTMSDPIDEAITYNTENNELLVPYIRQAMYYETDQMGVIHHSNYIRWFEEARLHFLEQIDLSYHKLESTGILIPVLGASCEYKSSVHFNDKVLILPKITYFNGFKMTVKYQILNSLDHKLNAYGETRHCFLNKEFKPINMKKDHKNIYDILAAWVNP